MVWTYCAEKRGETYVVKSIRRTVIALLHNYIEIMFWFGTIISVVSNSLGVSINVNCVEYIISTILCVSIFDSSALENIMDINSPILLEMVFLEKTTVLLFQ